MPRGPCAKRQVRCDIFAFDGSVFTGKNDCENPQSTCPRLPRDGYEKCQSVCNQAGHAEMEALKKAGEKAKGSIAYIFGHYYICEPCGAAMHDAGVSHVIMVPRK